MSRQTESEHSTDGLEEIQAKLQLEVFHVCHNLLNSAATIPPWVFYLLTLVETVQLLWFSLHPMLVFQDSSLGVPQLKSVLSYLSVDAMLAAHPSLKSPILIFGNNGKYVGFVLTVLYVSGFVVVWVLLSRPQPNARLNGLVLTFVNVLVLLFNGVLVLPLTEIIGNVLMCQQSATLDLQCYDATYTLLCVFAVLIALVMLVSLVLSALLFYIRNPFNSSFMSLRSNFYVLPKAAVKLGACVYFIIDSQGQYINVYIYGYTVLLLGYLYFFRVGGEHHHKLQFYYYQLGCETTLVVFSLVTIIQYYLSKPEVPELTLVYGSMMAALLGYLAIDWERSNQKFDYDKVMETTNSAAYLQLIRHVIYQVEDSNALGRHARILAIVKAYHGKDCHQQLTTTEVVCGCMGYLADLKSDSWRNQPTKQLQSSYKFLCWLLVKAQKMYCHNNEIRILLSQLLYFRMGCKVKSILLSNETAEDKPTFRQRFELYCLRCQFKQDCNRQDLFHSTKFFEVNSYLTFSHEFLTMQDQIEKCIQNYVKFWCELMQDSPSLLRLSSLSGRVQVLKGDIEKAFESCNAMFSLTSQAVTMYLSYLMITNPSVQSCRKADELLTKMTTIQRQQPDQTFLVRSLKKMCVLTIGAKKGAIGDILNCSSQIKGLLGFDRHDIIGQNIYKLMPKCYHEVHPSFLQGFVGVPDRQIADRLAIKTLVLDARGFSNMCSQLLRISPSIQHGFKFISFCQLVTQEEEKVKMSYLVYSQPSMMIQAVSDVAISNGSSEKFVELITQINVGTLFPQLDLAELEENVAVSTVLDTRLFASGISRDEIDIMDYCEQADYNAKVKVMLERTISYKGTHLKRLKYFLVCEQPRKLSSNRRSHVRELKSKQVLQLQAIQEEIDNTKEKNQFVAVEGSVPQMLVDCRLTRKLRMLFAAVVVSYVITLVCLVAHAKNSIDIAMVHRSAFSKLNATTEITLVSEEVALNGLVLSRRSSENITDQQFSSAAFQVLQGSNELQDLLKQVYVFYQDQYFPAAPYELPTGEFLSSSGSETIGLADAMSRVIYSSALLSQQPISSFASYPPTNPELSSELFIINSNCPQKLPALADKLTQNLHAILSAKIASKKTILNLLLYGAASLLLLGVVVIVLLGWWLMRCHQKLLAVYNHLTMESVCALKDKCEAYMSQHFEKANPQPFKKKKRRKTIQRDLTMTPNFNITPNFNSDIQQSELDDAINEEAAQLKEQPERKCVRALAVSPLAHKFRIVLAFLFVAIMPIVFYFLDSMVAGAFDGYSANLQSSAAVKRLNLLTCLFAEECYFTRSKHDCEEFSSTTIQLYAATQQYYSVRNDTNKNRAAIYGQVEKLKVLLAQSSSKAGEVRQAVSVLMDVQEALLSETASMIGEVDQYISSTLTLMVKIEGVAGSIVLLVSYWMIYILLVRRLQNRNQSSEHMMAMFPLQLLRTDDELLRNLQQLTKNI